jgi:hypothetical protein
MTISENAYAFFSSAAEFAQGVAYTIRDAASKIPVPEAVHDICERMVNVSSETIDQTVNYLAELQARNPHLADVDLKIAALAIVTLACLWVNGTAVLSGAVIGALAPVHVVGYSAAALKFAAALSAEAKVSAVVLGVIAMCVKPSRDFICTKVIPFTAGMAVAVVVTTGL